MSSANESRYLAAGVGKREVWSWAMFDFANSGYTTVVITAIFNAYFVGVVTNNEDWGTFAWTASLGVSYALIMIAAPLVGAYADAYAAKKRLLLLTTVGCLSFTALLYFVGPGDLGLAILLIVLSNFFFGCGENLIAAFFAGTGSEQGSRKSVGLGLESGLYRRAGQLGRFPDVCPLGAE